MNNISSIPHTIQSRRGIDLIHHYYSIHGRYVQNFRTEGASFWYNSHGLAFVTTFGLSRIVYQHHSPTLTGKPPPMIIHLQRREFDTRASMHVQRYVMSVTKVKKKRNTGINDEMRRTCTYRIQNSDVNWTHKVMDGNHYTKHSTGTYHSDS